MPSELVALQAKIRRVLAIYFPKHQNTRDNTAWEVMHEIIAFGVDSQLYRGGPQGPKVNAIGWLCYNGSCKGEQMLYLDRGQPGRPQGPGSAGAFWAVPGHPGPIAPADRLPDAGARQDLHHQRPGRARESAIASRARN